jgi:hypothetical protein
LENRIGLQQAAQLAQTPWELGDQRIDAFEIASGKIAVDAANPHVVGMHARAAGGFLQIENVLAQVKAVEKDRNRAEIDAVGTKPHAVRGYASQLHVEHANVLGTLRNAVRDAEQLLDAQHVAQRVRRRREVVHAFGIGLPVRPEQVLHVLFDAGVQIADLGLGLDYGFAFDLEHNLQHAVRRGMLRPHREHHRIAFVRHDLRRQWRRRKAHVDSPPVNPLRSAFGRSADS